MAESSPKGLKTLWKKEKLLITSNSPYPSVFKTLVLQTHENQGLFGKGLRNPKLHNHMFYGKAGSVKTESRKLYGEGCL